MRHTQLMQRLRLQHIDILLNTLLTNFLTLRILHKVFTLLLNTLIQLINHLQLTQLHPLWLSQFHRDLSWHLLSLDHRHTVILLPQNTVIFCLRPNHQPSQSIILQNGLKFIQRYRSTITCQLLIFNIDLFLLHYLLSTWNYPFYQLYLHLLILHWRLQHLRRTI